MRSGIAQVVSKRKSRELMPETNRQHAAAEWVPCGCSGTAAAIGCDHPDLSSVAVMDWVQDMTARWVRIMRGRFADVWP
jgi:hypothetical protein